jgi:hypothetical protein
MNNIKKKINITSSQIDDIYYYEWKNVSDITIIFVGGAFVTIQSYFDFLDHISNELSVKIIAIPLLYQDHSSFKMLDFTFEKQKKIIDKIVHKVTFSESKTIFVGVDIGASIGLYLNHDFNYYFLINPFSEWNPLIQNKLFHKISQIPLLYDFIKEYLIKFITFNIFFRIPPKFLTHLSFQHYQTEPNGTCTTCKPVFGNEKPENVEMSAFTSMATPSHFNVIEFSSLNTFFELGVFYNIEEKLRIHQKKVFLFFNENTITNIKHFFEIAKKCNIHNLQSVSEFQGTLYELFQKKTSVKNSKSQQAQFDKSPYKNDSHNQHTPYNGSQHSSANNNSLKNISALPAFMTAQPPTNPLQPLLDLFQNNPSSVPPLSQGAAYPMFGQQQHPSSMNPMQNYLNGITNTNIYANQIGANPLNVLPKMNQMPQNPFNLPKQNPQHLQNSNIIFNTGNI